MSYYKQTQAIRQQLIDQFNGKNGVTIEERHPQIRKNVYGNQLAVTINGKTTIYNINEWSKQCYIEFMNNLSDEQWLIDKYNVSRAEAKIDEAWERGSEEEQLRTYVKESYRLGKDSLTQVLNTALADCSYSIDFLKSIYDFDFRKTSAVLYRGVYVTPCMLEVVAHEWCKANGYANYTREHAKMIVEKFLRATA